MFFFVGSDLNPDVRFSDFLFFQIDYVCCFLEAIQEMVDDVAFKIDEDPPRLFVRVRLCVGSAQLVDGLAVGGETFHAENFHVSHVLG
jgi:hypothetical protein